MIHQLLVSRAISWLKSKGHQTVVCKSSSVCWENPDALGWKASGFSTMIEVKVSRSDFLCDKKKMHRLLAGLGNYRFFLTPPKLLDPNELPDKWGLLEAKPNTIRVIKKAIFRSEKNFFEELKHLLAYIRRNRSDDNFFTLEPGVLPDACI
jgi:hypothetical protein